MHIANGVKGVLHPTDTCDDYNTGTPFPSPRTVVNGVIDDIDKPQQLLVLSIHRSQMGGASQNLSPCNHQISNIEELKLGQTVRGFIKSITEHGLFVSLGRNVDARIQIKELFDEVCDLISSLARSGSFSSVYQRLEITV